MLGEFFAARADEIDDEVVDDGPFERFQTVEAQGLTPVSLATLAEIIGLDAYDELVDRFADVPVGQSDEVGVLTIPTEFRDALAGDLDRESVARRWCATDELSLDEWLKDDALLVLNDVGELAHAAVVENRELWYWWSL